MDELDKKRKEEFKEYEMQKEHERKEYIKTLPEEEKKKAEEKHVEMEKKHQDHPKLHHPVRTKCCYLICNISHLDQDSKSLIITSITVEDLLRNIVLLFF